MLRAPSQPARVSAPSSPTGTSERSSFPDSSQCSLTGPGQLLLRKELSSDLFRAGAKLGECESRFAKLVDEMGKAETAKKEAIVLLKGEQKLREWLATQLQRLDEYTLPQEE